MSSISAEREVMQNRTRKRDRSTSENMKTTIHESYYQAFQDKRKRFYIDNIRPVFGYDIFESDQRSPKCKRNIIELLKYDLKAI